MDAAMVDQEESFRRLEAEIDRRLLERFAALRDEFDRLRLESDRRWAGYLSRFEQDFTGIVPRELLETPAPATATPAAGGGQVSVEHARYLDEGENQVEILRRFLDLCRECSSRAVLFVARGGALEAWKAVGFSDRGGDDEVVRKVSVPLGDPAVSRALEGTPVSVGGENVLSRALEVTDAPRAVLLPMVVREKISGLVYADCAPGEEAAFDPDRIALLTHLAGSIVDRLATRRLRPSPPLRPMEEVSTRAPVVSEAEMRQELESAAEAPPELEPPSFAAPPPVEEPAAPAPRVAAPSETIALPVPPLPQESPATTGSWAAVIEPPPEPRGVEPPPTYKPAADLDSRPSTTTRRLAGPLAPADGDERREEARRFARLLVSEIKLYNERAVVEGRQNQDLYTRLREDIDRSRQMYDERIPEDIRSNSNYFYEEMVRILADGRPEALGL
jgi:hypothetical protein